MTGRDGLVIDAADDLDVPAMLAVADGAQLSLSPRMLDSVSSVRRDILRRLRTGEPVYGVNTGMGAASEVRLDEAAQSLHQDNLMLARAVGSAPWLGLTEVRAIMVVRLRTFLGGDAGVSPELCQRLTDLLNLGVVPAVPSSRLGTAGEIIPLAHLGGCLTGSGEFLADGSTVPAARVLASVGLAPFALGPKEGVAFIEGVPVTTALAMLRARDARALADQAVVVIAGALALVGASRDPFGEAVARGDDELAAVLAAVRDLAGTHRSPRALQSPLSFRVAGPALAQLLRAIAGVHAAVDRVLHGVTDSPAYLGGRFVGTAGFDGFDLAASLDALRVSAIHLAETSAARLHRLLNDSFTGLPRQLSDAPGLHAGMVVVQKRAVGVNHALLAAARPASLGAIETSLGQEDVQSFSVEAAMSCGEALEGARDVLACELLGVVQGERLAGWPLDGVHPDLANLLAAASAALPTGTADRPFGRDVAVLAAMLSNGWAVGALRAVRSSLGE